MARIITAGNETGDWAGDGFVAFAGSPGDAVNSRFRNPSPGNRGGNYSFFLGNNQGISYDVTPQIPGGPSEFYFRVAMHRNGRCDGIWEMLRFLSPSGSLLFRFGSADLISGSVVGAPFSPQIRNSVNSIITSNTDIPIPNNAWFFLEIYAKFSTGADGAIDGWISGRKVLEYRGQLASGTLETALGSVVLYNTIISGGNTNGVYYDDIALNDTSSTVNNGRVGQGWVLPLWPANNGATSDLTNTFNNSTDNFKFVNKPVARNPSGFVGTSTPNDKDTYVLNPIPDVFGGVNAIRVAAYGVRSGPSITKAKLLVTPPAQSEIDLPSGVGVGEALPFGVPRYIFQDFNSNPNTSNEPFTKAEVNGMEAGIQFIA